MAKTQRKPLTFEEDRHSGPSPAQLKTPEQRQQIGARITTGTYRQLKARAALQGVTVAALVEQAIAEFLTNHASP
jgi:hypothetical protein